MVLKPITNAEFANGAIALNLEELGVPDGAKSVFIQEKYNRTPIPTIYIAQLQSGNVVIYGRIISGGNIAPATGSRNLDLLFMY